ncbi:ABC transporter ATP-binding protein [Paenibacillus sp. GCM10027626]|uniref:ABC transporter ATP-binding protein n=1 Tax=Paenibacillus sp. GCM10027626 TaxID=3273411 RepID=UPI003634EF23
MIEAKAVTKLIDGRPVLSGISFQMPEGAMYGIIGPNGAGKSTLLRLMSGVDAPTEGSLTLHGKAASSYGRKELARWLAVLQQGGLDPAGFTVKEVLAMGRYPFQNWLGEEKKDAEPIIADALRLMGLTALAERKLDQLSGGERQRVALAKVMVQEPQLLLLDEPTTFLDIGYQVSLLDTVKQWQQEKKLTVVAVLHDLNLAAHYCDFLLVLNQGRIEAFGRPEQIIEPELIAQVYGAKGVVVRHPVTGVPQLLLQPSGPG